VREKLLAGRRLDDRRQAEQARAAQNASDTLVLTTAAGTAASRAASSPAAQADARGAASERAVPSAAGRTMVAQSIASIMREGLRPGTFVMRNGTAGPLPAQIDLMISRPGASRAVLRIDLDALRRAGYRIPEATADPRTRQSPGGGAEVTFPYAVPPRFIEVLEQ
jgi:hypothetical protein